METEFLIELASNGQCEGNLPISPSNPSSLKGQLGTDLNLSLKSFDRLGI